jgi:ABC-type microcin C transport system duplicated ATPase subunit YejF
MPLLQINDLHTQFSADERVVKAVDGIAYEVGVGETVAPVGSSPLRVTTSMLVAPSQTMSSLALSPRTRCSSTWTTSQR